MAAERVAIAGEDVTALTGDLLGELLQRRRRAVIGDLVRLESRALRLRLGLSRRHGRRLAQNGVVSGTTRAMSRFTDATSHAAIALGAAALLSLSSCAARRPDSAPAAADPGGAPGQPTGSPLAAAGSAVLPGRSSPSRASPSTRSTTGCTCSCSPTAQADTSRVNVTVHGRLAARGLRRDRHGAPARAHAVQGHRRSIRNVWEELKPARRATSTRRPGTTAPTTSRRCRPATTTSRGRSRWRPTAWSTRTSRRRTSTMELLGRPQRVRDRREQPGRHPRRADAGRPRTSGTTTASRPSARGPTSRSVPAIDAQGVLPEVLPAR